MRNKVNLSAVDKLFGGRQTLSDSDDRDFDFHSLGLSVTSPASAIETFRINGMAAPEQPPAAFCLCACQANIQAALRPGAWIPGVRSLHQYVEDWQIPAGPQVTVDQVVSAVKLVNNRGNNHGNILLVNRVESNSLIGFVRILAFTKKRWLSVLELDILAAPEEGCYVTARAFSTGLLPVIVPASFLWNSLLFFVPFYDGGRNAVWLRMLRDAINVEVYVKSGRRKC